VGVVWQYNPTIIKHTAGKYPLLRARSLGALIRPNKIIRAIEVVAAISVDAIVALDLLQTVLADDTTDGRGGGAILLICERACRFILIIHLALDYSE